MQFDHLTIRTRNPEASKAFFEQVFDLVEGERPAIIRQIPGCWLFNRNRPVVHLITMPHGNNSIEEIDHLAIRPKESSCDFRKRLERLNLSYSLMDLFELRERRIFFRTSGGVLLEAVFDEAMPPPYTSQNRP